MAADVKIFATNVEQACLDQIRSVASCSVFDGAKIRIMPDCHAGKGCVIGFTANLGDKIVPNLVGVDIGCGVYVRKLAEPVTDFGAFDKAVRDVVPMGFELQSRYMFNLSDDYDFACHKKLKNKDRLEKSLGTLGGGNHCIEIDEDASNNQYLVIHTGSRNLGLQVCNIYQHVAEKNCDSEFSDLAWLEGDAKDEYVHDMREAQAFARRNRERIAGAIMNKLHMPDAVESWHTVHNYLGDDNVIRKGAVQALKGQKIIVPMNMKDGSVVGYGKGLEDWNNSAPHGAGRAMSRKKAFKCLDADKFKREMNNVYSTSVCRETLDEAPEAYKSTNEVVGWLSKTIELEDTLLPVYNAKAL